MRSTKGAPVLSGRSSILPDVIEVTPWKIEPVHEHEVEALERESDGNTRWLIVRFIWWLLGILCIVSTSEEQTSPLGDWCLPGQFVSFKNRFPWWNACLSPRGDVLAIIERHQVVMQLVSGSGGPEGRLAAKALRTYEPFPQWRAAAWSSCGTRLAFSSSSGVLYVLSAKGYLKHRIDTQKELGMRAGVRGLVWLSPSSPSDPHAASDQVEGGEENQQLIIVGTSGSWACVALLPRRRALISAEQHEELRSRMPSTGDPAGRSSFSKIPKGTKRHAVVGSGNVVVEDGQWRPRVTNASVPAAVTACASYSSLHHSESAPTGAFYTLLCLAVTQNATNGESASKVMCCRVTRRPPHTEVHVLPSSSRFSSSSSSSSSSDPPFPEYCTQATPAPVHRLSFSPNGKKLLALDIEGNLAVFKVRVQPPSLPENEEDCCEVLPLSLWPARAIATHAFAPEEKGERVADAVWWSSTMVALMSSRGSMSVVPVRGSSTCPQNVLLSRPCSSKCSPGIVKRAASRQRRQRPGAGSPLSPLHFGLPDSSGQSTHDTAACTKEVREEEEEAEREDQDRAKGSLKKKEPLEEETNENQEGADNEDSSEQDEGEPDAGSAAVHATQDHLPAVLVPGYPRLKCAFVVQQDERWGRTRTLVTPSLAGTELRHGLTATLKHVCRYHRVHMVRQTTPERLFAKLLNDREYSAAMEVAVDHDLDTDMVHQAQWEAEDVSRGSIREHLSRVYDTAWVLRQCCTRVPLRRTAARHLLLYGLQRAKDTSDSGAEAELSHHLSRLDTYEALLKDKRDQKESSNNNNNNNDEEDEDDALDCVYSPSEYEEFRSKPLEETARGYARRGQLGQVLVLVNRHPEALVHHLMEVMDSVPEHVSPRTTPAYSSLLDTCLQLLLDTYKPRQGKKEDEGTTSSCILDQLVEWTRKRACTIDSSAGLCENALQVVNAVYDAFCRWQEDRCHEDDTPPSQIQQRHSTKTVDFFDHDAEALQVLGSGSERDRSKSSSSSPREAPCPERTATALRRMVMCVRALNMLVYVLRNEAFSLHEYISLPPYRTFQVLADSAHVLCFGQKGSDPPEEAQVSSPGSRSTLLPCVSSQSADAGETVAKEPPSSNKQHQCALFSQLMVHIMDNSWPHKHSWVAHLEAYIVKCASVGNVDALKSVVFASRPEKSNPMGGRPIKSSVALLHIALEGLYECPRTDAWETFDAVFESLPVRREIPEGKQPTRLEVAEQRLQDRVDLLEHHLSASVVLARYQCSQPLSFYTCIDQEASRLLVTRLAHKVERARPAASSGQWQCLLSDILAVRQQVFPHISTQYCYQQFCAALLRAGKLELAKKHLEEHVATEQGVSLAQEAAQLHFNSAASVDHPEMQLARDCIGLFERGTALPAPLAAEKHLIDGVSLLQRKYGIDLLPVQVRLRLPRAALRLVYEAIRSSPHAHTEPQDLVRLACLLVSGTPRGTHALEKQGWWSEAQKNRVTCKVFHLVALVALHRGDLRKCESACDHLQELNYGRAWDVCFAAACRDTLSTEGRLRLAAFAVAYCPPHFLDTAVALHNDIEAAQAMDSPAAPLVDNVPEAETLLAKKDLYTVSQDPETQDQVPNSSLPIKSDTGVPYSPLWNSAGTERMSETKDRSTRPPRDALDIMSGQPPYYTDGTQQPKRERKAAPDPSMVLRGRLGKPVSSSQYAKFVRCVQDTRGDALPAFICLLENQRLERTHKDTTPEETRVQAIVEPNNTLFNSFLRGLATFSATHREKHHGPKWSMHLYAAPPLDIYSMFCADPSKEPPPEAVPQEKTPTQDKPEDDHLLVVHHLCTNYSYFHAGIYLKRVFRLPHKDPESLIWFVHHFLDQAHSTQQ